MASSGLRGPFILTGGTIDAVVKQTSAGAYALGWTDEKNVFHIQYVGRADDDVKKSIKDWLPTPYAQFKFEYYPSAKAAYFKECELYHDFSPPDSTIHPAALKGSSLACPRCGT